MFQQQLRYVCVVKEDPHQVKWRPASVIRCADFSTVFEQVPSHLHSTQGHCRMEWRIHERLIMTSVHVRPFLDENPGDAPLLRQDRTAQRCVPTFCCCVDVGPVIHQQSNDRGIAHSHSRVYRRSSTLVGGIDIGPVLEE